MKIVIVDDHQLVINGFLKLLIEKEIRAVATFTKPKEALRQIPILKPDIVLTDLDMPGLNGVELIEQVRKVRPEQKFIMLTMHLNQQIVKKMLGRKINGYLSKNAHPEELFQALEAVSNGRSYYSSDVAKSLAFQGNKITTENPMLTLALSEREREVLKLIAHGEPTKGIAEKLHISIGTVETHRRSIMIKLEVNNMAGMVRIAVQEGLV